MWKKTMNKNLKIILIAIAVILFVLVGRLFYIQVICSDQFLAALQRQSMIKLIGSNTRGIIYDRYGEALVADNRQYIYIIRKEDFNKSAKKIMKALKANTVTDNNEDYHVYSSENYKKTLGKKLVEKNHAYIVEAAARYSKNQIGAHLIGYVNRQDSSGAAGMELMLEEELNSLNRGIYAAADVKGKIIPGRGLKITSQSQKDSSIREGIRTTLDKEKQGALEDIISQEERDCAVVVLDSHSGDILAMASSPTFNPNNAQKYIKKGGDRLVNKATQGEYAPGSVFKIVVAAAALEEGTNISQQYECSGAIEIEGLTVGCETGGGGGHGRISFENALAQSCNSYFIQLGRNAGSRAIIETAKKMGLGEKALRDYPQESTGHVMTESESFGAGICNLSIGQGQTLVTPLQVARMTNIIASGGIDRGVHILAEEEAENKQVISANTAEEVGKMMRMVTEEGTVEFLQMNKDSEDIDTAVKTGTAEFKKNELAASNAWITGFAPCDDPEFVITVLVEEGESGSSVAGPLYKKILQYLRNSGSFGKAVLA